MESYATRNFVGVTELSGIVPKTLAGGVCLLKSRNSESMCSRHWTAPASAVRCCTCGRQRGAVCCLRSDLGNLSTHHRAAAETSSRHVRYGKGKACRLRQRSSYLCFESKTYCDDVGAKGSRCSNKQAACCYTTQATSPKKREFLH